MLEAAEARLGAHAKRLLADTGYACLADIAALGTRAEAPVTVFAPPPPEKEATRPEALAAGLRKVQAVVLLQAIAHNLRVSWRLRAAATPAAA